MSSIFFILMCLPSSGPVANQHTNSFENWLAQAVGPDPAALVAKCKKMNESEYEVFVKKLGEKKDFESLKVLYTAEGVYHQSPLATACIHMPDEKAVDFCLQFEHGSDNWRAAVFNLNAHPIKAVHDYVKRVASSGDSYDLMLCYDVCRKGGWDDLLESARRHAADNEELVPLELNWPIGIKETVGRHARLYIERMKKAKAIKLAHP